MRSFLRAKERMTVNEQQTGKRCIENYRKLEWTEEIEWIEQQPATHQTILKWDVINVAFTRITFKNCIEML